MKLRPKIDVTLHFIGELREEIQLLGSITVFARAQESLLAYCPICGDTLYKILVRNGRRTFARVYTRAQICTECGGDNTMLFNGNYWQHFFNYEILPNVTFPQKIIDYELQALASRKGEPWKLIPQYGELL